MMEFKVKMTLGERVRSIAGAAMIGFGFLLVLFEDILPLVSGPYRRMAGVVMILHGLYQLVAIKFRRNLSRWT